jgi:hypothetical protein
LQKRNEQLEVQRAALPKAEPSLAGRREHTRQFERTVADAELSMNWRVSPHCRVVNLVRSGRKQPQLLTASAGVRLASYFERGAVMKNIAISYYYSMTVSINRVKKINSIGFALPVISTVV